MILLAVIVSPHGVRGALKVKTFTQDPKGLLAYGGVCDEHGQEYQLQFVRLAPPDCLIVTIKGIENRTQAESLKGTHLYIQRSQLPDLTEEEFYHSDLIGLPVKDQNEEEVGVVKAVGNFGAEDFLEIVTSEGRFCTISFTKEAVPIIQLSQEQTESFIQINLDYLLGKES